MSDSVPTIASGAVRKLFLTVESLGLDPRAVFAKVPLPPGAKDDPDARVALSTLYDLWEAALPAMGRPDASLLAAATYVPGDYGIVGFVAMNSATLGEGLRHVIRYVGLWTDDPVMELAEEGTLRLDYRQAPADRLGLRCAAEAGLAEILHSARLLTQQPLCPLEVRFAHPAPSDRTAHERFFGTAVLFEQADHAMVFRREDLGLALPKADAMLGEYLRTLANETLSKRKGSEPSPDEQLREILAEDLPRGLPSAEQIAKRLGTSERTLRRRLEEKGTSFRDVVDATRADLARRYVRDSRLPLSEVAFLLGFAEPSAFHRAFKRWTGTTPASWREPARRKSERP